MNKGIKNTQMCKMWLKFVHMWPKKKQEKKIETFMQLTHKLGCNQQKEIKK